jgi:hypothetical protein
MNADVASPATREGPPHTDTDDGEQAARALRRLVIAAGPVAALLLIVVGLAFDLQMYGDGSIFSYAVAVEDVWAFHWHNIAVRATVWLAQLLPGEILVGLTGDPRIGIFTYGFLSFSAQAAGLAATFVFDRTAGKTFFVFACASTACLAPLVFGFPSEMLLAHALFWPTFALAFCARPTLRATALLFVFMLALVFSHEAALGLVFGIVAALSLRGPRALSFLRALACFLIVVAIWLAVNAGLPPDTYFAEVRLRAASEFFDARSFAGYVVLLLAATLAGYGALVVVCARVANAWLPRLAARRDGVIPAMLLTLAALALWWTQFDTHIHADNRYYARTVLLVGMCGFAAICVLTFLRREGGVVARIPVVSRVLDVLATATAARVLAGALSLVLVVHVVETVKFVRAWSDYRTAVRSLAMGVAADPDLGAPFYVSSRRIGGDLNRLAWFSTTPYLSALVADLKPVRLVVDPAGNYFWISCATATVNAAKENVVPKATREMIRVYACGHKR